MKRPKVLLSLLIPVLSASMAATQPAHYGCGAGPATHRVLTEASRYGLGLLHAPRNAIRLENLKWELPIGAATGLLIAQVDRPSVNRIQSLALEENASRWSNASLSIELGTATLMWAIGCTKHNNIHSDSGLTALAAAGAATALDSLLKVSFNRQYPTMGNSQGKFWGGGKSFPSAHAAASFGFASVIAKRYPRNHWAKVGAYALAMGVSLSRYPAKKHFPSDILVGAAIGYVSGTNLAEY
jgi:membrane-associated phospholipid phosphatase